MKASTISSIEGYLGPYVHNHKLKVGNRQKMIFSPEDEGPYWMTPEEREQKRKDHYGSTMIQKEYTKPQLIEMLEKEKGIVSPKGNRQQIRDMAQPAGIALTYEKRKIRQGWEGLPKGWNRFFGNEGGSIQWSLAKCTRSMGQRIQWELCTRTLVFNISCQTSKISSRKRLCCVSKQGRWES
jgi:hypothetical protein